MLFTRHALYVSFFCQNVPRVERLKSRWSAVLIGQCVVLKSMHNHCSDSCQSYVSCIYTSIVQDCWLAFHRRSGTLCACHVWCLFIISTSSNSLCRWQTQVFRMTSATIGERKVEFVYRLVSGMCRFVCVSKYLCDDNNRIPVFSYPVYSAQFLDSMNESRKSSCLLCCDDNVELQSLSPCLRFSVNCQ